jgi:hypothetical protein
VSGVCGPCQTGDHYNCTPGSGRCGCEAALRTDGTWTDRPPPPPSALRDAARLRSLAATFDNRLNREQTFTGAQVAAMLRDGEA